MKKRMHILLMAVLCMCIFTGCFCQHEWEDANCTSPATCNKCEATEGEAKGHDWKMATCATPQTCVDCGATEGDTLPHLWVDATCTAPKTCLNCGATEGDVLPHHWIDATCIVPKTCAVCAVTEGETIEHTWTEDSTKVIKTCNVCQKVFEYYYDSVDDELWVWTESETDDAGNLINLVSYHAERDEHVEWVQDGELKCWESGDQVSIFFPEMYCVDGKIYYRERAGGGAQRARRLAQAARKYVSFKSYWYGDGDHIDLVNSDDFWEVIENPLGSAVCAVDSNGTKYVIVHKGSYRENPLDTFAVKMNW